MSSAKNPSELPETLVDWGKLHVADFARLMADNQRILDATHRHAEDKRRFDRRLRDQLAASRFGAPPETSPAATAETGEPMHILIDSPTTYQQPAPPPPARGLSPLATAALATALGLAGLGTGAGVVAGLGALRPEPAAQAAPPETASPAAPTLYELHLGHNPANP